MEITANFEEILFSQKEGPDHTSSRNYHFQDHFGSVIIRPHYIAKNYELCVVFGLDVS